jgi:lipid II:glycine glycyltransferase (peptidoglycan interpeptide bridge formation enzyme)
MIEVNNRFYIQRFFAKTLLWTDIFKAVTYTQFEGNCKIPFYYKKINGETSTLELTHSIDELFASFKSNTRNEINRAIKEGCEFSYNYDYESFVPFYNEFCKSKGFDDFIDERTLSKYDKTIITVARHNKLVLAMHATVINKKDKEAMLLYSCSQRLSENVDRKLIGWGSRFLHYKEFELFKQMGIEKYEWNGVCTDPNRKDVYNITQFKLSFGSEAKKSLGLRTPLFVLLKSIQRLFNKVR